MRFEVTKLLQRQHTLRQRHVEGDNLMTTIELTRTYVQYMVN